MAASGSNRLLVVAKTGAVNARFPVGAHPTAVAYNPVRHEVVCSTGST